MNESCFWWFWFKQPHCQRFQLVFYALGPLQIQFLSGATRHPICQHFQLYQEISEYSLLPCLCDSDEAQQDDKLHIMWLTMDTDDTTESHILNHIISLVPNRGIYALHMSISSPPPLSFYLSLSLSLSLPISYILFSFCPLLNVYLSYYCYIGFLARAHGCQPTNNTLKINFKYCLLKRFGHCAIDRQGDLNDPTMDGIDWIRCDQCGSLFRSVYVGFCKAFFDHHKSPFVCMCGCPSNESEMYIIFFQ